MATAGALGLVAILAVACSPAAPVVTPSPSPSDANIPSVDADLLRYTCGRLPFGPEVLDITRNDELAITLEAAALRAHLAQPDMDIDWLPDHGWTLVGTDATGAEFVTVTDGDPGRVGTGRAGTGRALMGEGTAP